MAEDEKGAEGAEVDAAAGLLAKNKELLGEVKALKARVRQYGDLEPDAIKDALEFKERAEAELAEKRGEFEKLRQKDAAKFQATLDVKAAREAKLTRALNQRLVDLELSRAIRDAGGDPKYVLAAARGQIEVQETEEDWEAVVKGANGKPGTMADLVKQLREEYPRAFDGTGSSGSGAAAGGGGGGGIAQPDPQDAVAMGKAADEWIRRNSTHR